MQTRVSPQVDHSFDSGQAKLKYLLQTLLRKNKKELKVDLHLFVVSIGISIPDQQQRCWEREEDENVLRFLVGLSTIDLAGKRVRSAACLLSYKDVPGDGDDAERLTIQRGVGQAVSYCVCHVTHREK